MILFSFLWNNLQLTYLLFVHMGPQQYRRKEKEHAAQRQQPRPFHLEWAAKGKSQVVLWWGRVPQACQHSEIKKRDVKIKHPGQMTKWTRDWGCTLWKVTWQPLRAICRRAGPSIGTIMTFMGEYFYKVRCMI